MGFFGAYKEDGRKIEEALEFVGVETFGSFCAVVFAAEFLSDPTASNGLTKGVLDPPAENKK